MKCLITTLVLCAHTAGHPIYLHSIHNNETGCNTVQHALYMYFTEKHYEDNNKKFKNIKMDFLTSAIKFCTSFRRPATNGIMLALSSICKQFEQ